MRAIWGIAALAALGCSSHKRGAGAELPKPPMDAALRPTDAAPPPPARKPPDNHRASAEACSKDGLKGDPAPGQEGCKSDQECNQAGLKGGRCRFHPPGHSPGMNLCEYDQCYADADCGQGSVCVCNGGGWRSNIHNVCVEGDCATDADCKGGQLCSPGPNNCGAATGFHCHTPADTCSNDEDCQQAGDVKQCGFVPELGHWGCVAQPMCPVG